MDYYFCLYIMSIINAYSYAIESYEVLLKNGSHIVVSDIFYINCNVKNKKICTTEDINNDVYNRKECLRLYNYNLSFYLCKLPGLTNEAFKEFVYSCTSNVSDIFVKFTSDMIDSSFFKFSDTTYYAELVSTSMYTLNDVYKKLLKECIIYYKNLDKHTLTSYDKLFYENTENPFRFTGFVQTLQDIKYYLSTKFDIPCVGGFTFNTSYDEPVALENKVADRSYMPKINMTDIKIYEYDLKNNNDIFKRIVRNDNIDGKKYMTMLSYDIETYTPGNPELTDADKQIMSIGIGIFKIEDKKPFERICLITKDFNKEDLSGKIVNNTIGKKVKTYVVSNEYSTDILDKTTYIILENEYELLRCFIYNIHKYSPIFISGFNNYKFDDRYVIGRMRYYDKLKHETLETLMLKEFGFYETIIKNGKPYHRHLIPRYDENFSIKYDSEEQKDNSTWKGSKITSVDNYVSIVMTDPKLYTQQSRGNLDTMLEVNNVLNPFDNKKLQKTGLSYSEMWNKWDNNTDIYNIALYCCQDAWICGTLLITCSILIDKIEMSTLSHTTICDSIFRAVTFRVSRVIENYAWKYNFAVMDKPIKSYDSNNRVIQRIDDHTLGGKKFDVRKVVGGQVLAKEPGKHNYVMALDFSAMYPSQKEGSNIDTTSFVPRDIIENSSKYGLKIVHTSHGYDMYNERYIYHMTDVNNNEYIVEEFSSEVKNDIQSITKAVNAISIENDVNIKNILYKELLELCPDKYAGLINGDISPSNIEHLYKERLYCVQSPKDPKTLLPTIHYSLKEIMLSDMRTLRDTYKKMMTGCKKSGDSQGYIRYNAKQLAIKILCNSEYGASQSKFFPYYDPLIGAAVTYGSRCLINILTQIITSEYLFIDKQFMIDNENIITMLSSHGVIDIEPYDDNIQQHRRISLCRLFDKYYMYKPTCDTYKLNIKPSTVIYQDTDSNYYINNFIKDEIMKNNNTPDAINIKMHVMMAHNELLTSFIYHCISRPPVGTGFEGAFIVARYFNVKKKYYGIKWSPDMVSKLDSKAYTDNILTLSYDRFWKPKLSTLPLSNGSYVYINSDKLLKQKIDYSKYAASQNIKCTGIDLARRDQFKFINFNHMLLISEDMKMIHYTGDNIWEYIPNMTLKDSVIVLLDKFKEQINNISLFVKNMLTNVEYDYDLPLDMYTLDDYSSSVKFNYNIVNTVNDKFTMGKITILKDMFTINGTKYKLSTRGDKYIYITDTNTDLKIDIVDNMFTIGLKAYNIIYRDIIFEKRDLIAESIKNRLIDVIHDKESKLGRLLTKTEFDEIFPSNYSRVFVVIMLTEDAKNDMLSGRKTNKIKRSDKSFTIQELRLKERENLSMEQYNMLTYHDECSYEQFIDLIIITQLDVKYYMKALCKALSLYVLDSEPYIANAINHAQECNDNDALKKLIEDGKTKITDTLLERYFTASKFNSKTTAEYTKKINSKVVKDMKTYKNGEEPEWWIEISKQLGDNITFEDICNPSKNNAYLQKLEDIEHEYSMLFDKFDKIYRYFKLTSGFYGGSNLDGDERKLYDACAKDETMYLKTMEILREKRVIAEKIMSKIAILKT